jgi:hypothetical protein
MGNIWSAGACAKSKENGFRALLGRIKFMIVMRSLDERSKRILPSKTSDLSHLHSLSPLKYLDMIGNLSFTIKDVLNTIKKDLPLPPAGSIEVRSSGDPDFAVFVAMVLKAFLDERPYEVNTLVRKIIGVIGFNAFISLPLEGDVFNKVIDNSKYFAKVLIISLEYYKTKPDSFDFKLDPMFVALAAFVAKVFMTPSFDNASVWIKENFAGIIKELDAIVQGPELGE